MAKYQITSSAGIRYGIYEGETEAEALDALARDAGYRDQAHAVEVSGHRFDGTVTPVEITTRELYIELCGGLPDAVAFEESVLNTEDACLPPCAVAVKGGAEPEPEYWAFLASEWSTASQEQADG